MRRRSSAGGEPVKTRRRKAAALKRRNGPKTVRRRSSFSSPKIQVARLTRERDEALKQQTATADVLKVISRSTFDLQVVLNILVESAAKLCEADFANVWRPHGPAYRVAATYQTPTVHKEDLTNLRLEPGRGSCVGRTLLEAKIVHIPDIREDAQYTPEFKKMGALGGYRTMLGVPLLREGKPIGVITLIRTTMRPFTDSQIELVTTFADQAVIAIENVRLFDELRQRTTDLTESLEQQTATSEVLRVISSSPGDLQPVFEAILESATRICAAKFGNLWLREGDSFRIAATHGAPPLAFAEFVRDPLPVEASASLVEIVRGSSVVHVPDLAASELYHTGNPIRRAIVDLGGARTLLSVALRKDNALLGAFNIYRQEVRPFSDKQIELVKNFAAQAVIAIENTRLLKELRQRTEDSPSRCSSRRRPPTCSRSSAARLLSCTRCSMHWWSRPHGSARPIRAPFFSATGICIGSPQTMGFRPN